MKKAYLALACVLLAPMLLVSVSSSATYDPWVDLDEDGRISIFDVVTLAGSYQTTGDPTKNVNVMNWPLDTQTFPKNLLLKATSFPADGYGWRNDLIEYAEPYLNYSDVYFEGTGTLTTTPLTIFDETFVYQNLPMKPYLIAGLPAMAIPFWISEYSGVDFVLEIGAYLGTISTDGQWTFLAYCGYEQGGYSGPFYTSMIYTTLGTTTPLLIQVNPFERLAVRILVTGYTVSGTTDLIWTMVMGYEGHDVFISIPIVEDF